MRGPIRHIPRAVRFTEILERSRVESALDDLSSRRIKKGHIQTILSLEEPAPDER